MEKSIKEKVFEILKVVLGEDATGVYCDDELLEGGDGEFYSNYDEDGFSYVIEDTREYSIYHGITRICIVPEDENIDWVIKLPIMAGFGYEYTLINENDENDEFKLYKEGEVYDACDNGYRIKSQKLCCFRKLNNDVNLMEEENGITGEVGEHLSEILLPNTFVGMFNDKIPVYIQRKISKTVNQKYSWCHVLSNEDSKVVTSLTDNVEYCELNDAFIIDCVKYYGYDTTQLILEELVNSAIDDLHSGNIGYTSDEQPVIFDYAGYDDEYIWNYNV